MNDLKILEKVNLWLTSAVQQVQVNCCARLVQRTPDSQKGACCAAPTSPGISGDAHSPEETPQWNSKVKLKKKKRFWILHKRYCRNAQWLCWPRDQLTRVSKKLLMVRAAWQRALYSSSSMEMNWYAWGGPCAAATVPAGPVTLGPGDRCFRRRAFISKTYSRACCSNRWYSWNGSFSQSLWEENIITLGDILYRFIRDWEGEKVAQTKPPTETKFRKSLLLPFLPSKTGFLALISPWSVFKMLKWVIAQPNNLFQQEMPGKDMKRPFNVLSTWPVKVESSNLTVFMLFFLGRNIRGQKNWKGEVRKNWFLPIDQLLHALLVPL